MTDQNRMSDPNDYAPDYGIFGFDDYVEDRYIELRDAQTMLENATERIAKLEAALKPFAEADLQAYTRQDDRFTSGPRGVTLGDFRRAHDTLYPPVLP